jgi:hypothetical protein
MKYFTPASANRTLPLVRRIAVDLIGLQAELGIRGERVKSLSTNKGLAMSVAHAEELAEVQASLEVDMSRIVEIQEELAALGAICHSPAVGAIDFPSFLEGREVRLCWMNGESEILFWHDINDPLAKRQPIEGERFSASAFSGEDPDTDREAGPRKSLQN